MIKVGLTGGIGCGKSTAADAFCNLGVPVIDADQISRDLVKPGQDALAEIVNVFGKDLLKDSGALDRSRLKEKVFTRDAALIVLENILHPRIKDEILKQIYRLERSTQVHPYVIVDVPLLVEKNYMDLFDRIVVVDCLPEQQFERIKKRDSCETETIEKIINKQARRDDRLKAATDIVDNSGTRDDLREQINQLHLKILASS